MESLCTLGFHDVDIADLEAHPGLNLLTGGPRGRIESMGFVPEIETGDMKAAGKHLV